jgi:hypothetical protein
MKSLTHAKEEGLLEGPSFSIGGLNVRSPQQTMVFENSFNNVNPPSILSPTMMGAQPKEHQESIDNLYTLKKVQSKVRNKLVPWIDFSSTSATLAAVDGRTD